MPLSDLLAAQAVVASLRAKDKKTAIQALAAAAAPSVGRSADEIFATLWQRERLGSTAVGNGVAIPHAKLAGMQRIFGMFARLEQPIDFEALDGRPVDLVFLLLAPEPAGADHLKALARVARLLRDESVAAKLRAARDAAAIYRLLSAPPASHAA